MKKVIIVGNRLHCGGTEIAMLALINQLMKYDYKVTLALKKKEGVLIDRIPTGVQVIEINCIGSTEEFIVKKDLCARVVFLAKRCLSRFKKKFTLYDDLLKEAVPLDGQYDLMIDFFGYGHFLTAYGAKMICAKRKALWIHDEDLSWMFKIDKYLQNYDKLFGVSKAVVKAILAYDEGLKDKAEVFYNVIDIDKIIEKSKEESEAIFDFNYTVLLTVGRIHEQKGIDILLESAKILKERVFRFRWYIIGGGEEDYYKDMAKQLKVDDCVIFVGMKTNPYPYIKACDLYIQPSKHEGYGLSILEARVLNKTIIATRLPCVEEQIIDGINGYLVELNPIAFSSKIIELSENKSKVDCIVDNLKKEKIDFSSEMKKLSNLFDN